MKMSRISANTAPYSATACFSIFSNISCMLSHSLTPIAEENVKRKKSKTFGKCPLYNIARWTWEGVEERRTWSGGMLSCSVCCNYFTNRQISPRWREKKTRRWWPEKKREGGVVRCLSERRRREEETWRKTLPHWSRSITIARSLWEPIYSFFCQFYHRWKGLLVSCPSSFSHRQTIENNRTFGRRCSSFDFFTMKRHMLKVASCLTSNKQSRFLSSETSEWEGD